MTFPTPGANNTQMRPLHSCRLPHSGQSGRLPEFQTFRGSRQQLWGPEPQGRGVRRRPSSLSPPTQTTSTTRSQAQGPSISASGACAGIRITVQHHIQHVSSFRRLTKLWLELALGTLIINDAVSLMYSHSNFIAALTRIIEL